MKPKRIKQKHTAGKRGSGFKLRKDSTLWPVMIVCAFGAVISLAVIAFIVADSIKTKNTYHEVRERAVLEYIPSAEADTGNSAQGDEWDGTGAVLDVDFETLSEQNADTVAWLHVPGAEISYPVVYYAGDNDYYMHRAFDGSDSAAGSIYLECTNAPDFSDVHSFLYGHNMSDKSMFGRLQERFQSEGAQETEPYFYLYLPDNTVRRYLVFSFYETSAGSDTYLTFSEADAYDWYASYVMTMSEMTAAATDGLDLLAARNEIVTLSTCAGPSGTTKRFVVHGILDGER